MEIPVECIVAAPGTAALNTTLCAPLLERSVWLSAPTARADSPSLAYRNRALHH